MIIFTDRSRDIYQISDDEEFWKCVITLRFFEFNNKDTFLKPGDSKIATICEIYDKTGTKHIADIVGNSACILNYILYAEGMSKRLISIKEILKIMSKYKKD